MFMLDEQEEKEDSYLIQKVHDFGIWTYYIPVGGIHVVGSLYYDGVNHVTYIFQNGQWNNNDDNLEVFPSHKEHALCHGNLEKIAYSLIRQKKILFNRETKTYYLSEEIKDNDNNT